MSEKPEIKSEKDPTDLIGKVGAKAESKLKAKKKSCARCLVRLGYDGAYRLVCGRSYAARRSVRVLDRPEHYGKLFMDADATRPWAHPGLFQCVALGGQGK